MLGTLLTTQVAMQMARNLFGHVEFAAAFNHWQEEADVPRWGKELEELLRAGEGHNMEQRVW